VDHVMMHSFHVLIILILLGRCAHIMVLVFVIWMMLFTVLLFLYFRLEERWMDLMYFQMDTWMTCTYTAARSTRPLWMHTY